ncbi:hypothetical protein CH373_16620 [Leptospira perolatii]|uniref:Uncharacterized protein n=2 Tax=Leptospira perolatii TaxID=2023191 RepID=A0A2M9ZIT1_9LEPT|nr:hypothetical protein CH360_15165 [Leptospira perolatii]PJZ71966.1 hypothetical protein CH373_16620 [Leptospira perolatii]
MLVVIPLILEFYYSYLPRDVRIVQIGGISLGTALIVLFIFSRINISRKMKRDAEEGRLRNGILVLKDILIIKEDKICHIFPREDILQIRSGWIFYSEGPDQRGVFIEYQESAREEEKEFSIDGEYCFYLEADQVANFLSDWLETGFLWRTGIIRELQPVPRKK